MHDVYLFFCLLSGAMCVLNILLFMGNYSRYTPLFKIVVLATIGCTASLFFTGLREMM